MRAGAADSEVWFLSRFRERAAASVMEHGFPRYRDRACRSSKGSPPGDKQGGTADQRFVPGAKYGSGDFLFLPHMFSGMICRGEHCSSAKNRIDFWNFQQGITIFRLAVTDFADAKSADDQCV